MMRTTDAHRSLVWLPWLVLGLLAGTEPVLAQATGSIRGKVTAAGAQPLSGAQVSVPGTGRAAVTNQSGEFVIDNPVSPADLAATIYTALGVPLDTWYKTQDGRPIALCPEGKPVKQLIG